MTIFEYKQSEEVKRVLEREQKDYTVKDQIYG